MVGVQVMGAKIPAPDVEPGLVVAGRIQKLLEIGESLPVGQVPIQLVPANQPARPPEDGMLDSRQALAKFATMPPQQEVRPHMLEPVVEFLDRFEPRIRHQDPITHHRNMMGVVQQPVRHLPQTADGIQ